MKLGRRRPRRSHGSDPRYQSQPWRRYRATYIARNPLCTVCGAIAEVVDHIKPARQYPDISFFDPSNHQSLCHRCHNSKRGRKSHEPRRYDDVKP